MTVVERHPAPERPATASCSRTVWGPLVPLWERCEQGWFVYGPDGRLMFANAAVAALLRRAPQLGTTRFVADVVPSARRALEQRWSDVRTGRSAVAESLLPVDVAGTTCALHLTMVGLDSPGGRSVVGTLRRTLPDPSAHDDKVAQVEAVLGQVMSELLAVAPDHLGEPAVPGPTLSARQREVMDLLVAGESTAAIAAQLSVSPHTVRNHTKAVFRALGVHSQTELIHRYRRS